MAGRQAGWLTGWLAEKIVLTLKILKIIPYTSNHLRGKTFTVNH